MKPVLIFAAGLAIGALVMVAVKPDHAAEAEMARQAERVAQVQVAGLQQQVEATRAELGRAVQESDSLRSALSESTTKTAEAQAAAKLNVPTGEAGKQQKFTDMIREVGKSQVKTTLEGKLATLKTRLQLTSEQEARLKEVATVEGEQTTQALERFLDGEGQPGDFSKLARLQRGDLPLAVESMLTADQRPAYAELLAEEKANRIEMQANAELLGLQVAGGLTPEQKDQAFAQLSQLARSEEEMDLDALTDGEAVRGFMDDAIGRRVAAMDPILSDSQMEIYQRQVEAQRQLMSQFMPPAKK